MGGGGLLIFYVANVANVANVIQVRFVAFCDRLFRAKAVPLHRNSKTTAPARVRKWYIQIYRGVPAC